MLTNKQFVYFLLISFLFEISNVEGVILSIQQQLKIFVKLDLHTPFPRYKECKFVLIGRNERSKWRSYLTFLRHPSTIVLRGSDVRLRLHVAVDVGSTVLKVRFQEVLGIFELEWEMEDRQKTCLSQRRIERHHQLRKKAGWLTDCLSGMENTMSCWQANCYDDLADVDRLDCCLGRKAHWVAKKPNAMTI